MPRLKYRENDAELLAPIGGECGKDMQRELAIRQFARREGYRLEKSDDGKYRLVNSRFNLVVYRLDGVPLERIAAFLEQRTSQANSPDARHR